MSRNEPSRNNELPPSFWAWLADCRARGHDLDETTARKIFSDAYRYHHILGVPTMPREAFPFQFLKYLC